MAHDDRNRGEEMAMLRLSLIAPLVNGTYTQASKAQYCREAACSDVTLPDGSVTRYSAATIRYWEWRYRHGGFEALVQAARSDAGSTRTLTPEQVGALEALRASHPRLSAAGLRRMMVDEGLIGEGDASDATFQRYVRNNPLPPAGGAGGQYDEVKGSQRRSGMLTRGLGMPYCCSFLSAGL